MTRTYPPVLSLLFAAGLWAAGSTTALAHEDAVLEASRSAVAPGESVVLDGSDFTAGLEYRLRLVGALEDHDVTKVQADSAGRFRVTVTVPEEVRPGRYRFVAVAGDGDEVAAAELRVTEAVESGAGTEKEDAGGNSDRRARTGEMELDRERNGLEWIVIVLLLGGAGGLGLGALGRATGSGR